MPDFKELKNKIKHGDFQFVYDELKNPTLNIHLRTLKRIFIG